jgi:hypothetical protein
MGEKEPTPHLPNLAVLERFLKARPGTAINIEHSNATPDAKKLPEVFYWIDFTPQYPQMHHLEGAVRPKAGLYVIAENGPQRMFTRYLNTEGINRIKPVKLNGVTIKQHNRKRGYFLDSTGQEIEIS